LRIKKTVEEEQIKWQKKIIREELKDIKLIPRKNRTTSIKGKVGRQ